jgi:hypothetical protein
MRSWFVAAALLFVCTSANAQNRELIIAGIGASPCSMILKNYREGPKAMGYLIISWAEGFWSSQNAMLLQAGTPMLKNLAGDSDARIKALMAECGGRPSEDFGLVVRDHFAKLPTFPNPNAK